MQNYSCPSCGAQIRFTSSVSVSCVCPYCQSLVVRRDKDVESIGKMAELPVDISPLQIGTSGKFEGVAFSIIGRMKLGWEDGVWNEWFIFSDSGKKGWLAEAQGFLAVSFEIEEEHAPDMFPSLGDRLTLLKFPYTVSDIKQCECIGSEGELPIIAPKGRKSRVVDLIGYKGSFASMEYNAPEPIRIYVGQYVEFDDLELSNLRELDGWEYKKRIKANGGW